MNASRTEDQPLHASTSEAVTNSVRVEVESQYAPEHSQPFESQWFFYYTVRITNEGEETVAVAEPSLGHHRTRPATSRKCAGPGVVGEQPVLGPRRILPVHVRLSAQDLDRRDARHLPDVFTGADRPLRRRDRALRAARALHRSLTPFRYAGDLPEDAEETCFFALLARSAVDVFTPAAGTSVIASRNASPEIRGLLRAYAVDLVRGRRAVFRAPHHHVLAASCRGR